MRSTLPRRSKRTLVDLSRRFSVRRILYDPYQMVSVAQRLTKQLGLPLEEFRQSPPNLTLASQGLFELLTGRNLVLYPDAEMRTAAAHAIAVESTSGSGWRIAKERSSHRIDVIVALAQAAYAAVSSQRELPPFDSSFNFVDTDVDTTPAPDVRTPEQRARDDAQANASGVECATAVRLYQ